MKRRDLIIVGGGPAGMAAALAAHRAGVRPTLVDENSAVGGQIYRQPPSTTTIAVKLESWQLCSANVLG